MNDEARDEPSSTIGAAARPAPQQHFEEGEESPPPAVFTMAIVRWLLVLAMAVAAAASLYYISVAPSGAPTAAEGTQYHCPMHPTVVRDGPGTCPICNMSLVAIEGAPSPQSAPSTTTAPGLVPIELPPERVQLIGMRTARVLRDTLPSQLRVVGVITPTEQSVTTVQTRFSGWIQELHVTSTGQPVAKGQLLARIYSPDLLAAQAELLNARRWSRGDGQVAGSSQGMLAETARSRLISLGMEPAQVAEVERTGTAHQLIEVRSPARGYVAEKAAVQGLFIQPGAELFRIADLTRVWAVIDVFERDAGRVRAGQPATLSLAAYPGETFKGKVALVYPVLNSETRTVRARIELKNPEQKLVPGMFGDVLLELPPTDGLFIPREALVDLGETQYVFVDKGDGRFEPRTVQAAARSGDAVQIVQGLSEGETVVTTGNFLLDSESRLRSAISGSAPPPAAAD